MRNYIPVQPVVKQKIADLPIYKQNEQIPFKIHDIGILKEIESCDQPALIHCNLFTILWVMKGSGSIIIDMDKLEINDSTIYFVKPGQVLSLDASENTEGYVLTFARSFLCTYEDQVDSLITSGLFDPSSGAVMIPLDPITSAEMHSLAEGMIGEFNRTSLGRNEILRGLLKIFLMYISRLYVHENRQYSKPGNTDLVKRFFELLEKNYISCRVVSDYAKKLAVTSNYLNDVVKKATGVSVSSHIQQRVVLEAKRKATHAQMTMKEVAYKLGFDDSYHFSKYFKKASGVNFSQFKKEISQQLAYA